MRPTLLVFARYPRPGHAKTRLIPALGTHGAALAQHRMTRDTLAAVRRAAATRDARVQIHVAGDPAATASLYDGPGEWVRQADGDLGRRLTAAQTQAGANGGPTVIVGSDCPALTADHLVAALDALAHADVVLGPAADGGYYLIACRRPTSRLFEGIDWSTDRVAAQTRAAAAHAGLSVYELGTLGDVDGPRDLPLLPPDYAPRRIAVTGAAGSLGTRWLAHLLAGSIDTRAVAVVRPGTIEGWTPTFREVVNRFGDRLTIIEQDLLRPDWSPADRKVIAACDDVWHFAGATHLHGRSDDEDRWRINEAGTAALLNTLSGVDRPATLRHISTAYVCGDRDGVVREEDTPPTRFRNGYESSKAAAEARVREAFAAGLRGCLLRPSVVIGDAPDDAGPTKATDQFVDALLAAARCGEDLILRAPCTATLNCVHGDWLMAAMSTIAARAGRDGETYHLTACHPIRLVDLGGTLAEMFPGWRMSFEPDRPARELPPISRRLDRAIAPLLPYLTAGVSFDRANLDRDAPALVNVPEFDAAAVLRWRRDLATEPAR